jgi:hypothetical protein
MPTTQHNSKAINARRFAALFAGFDTGNTSDEEALSKGRALRRVAAENNMRIVDLLEMPEIREAIDDQMSPVRNDGRELQSAMEQAAALREELTERTRDVRKLVEALTRQKETTEALREELGVVTRAQVHNQTGGVQWNTGSSPARFFYDVSHSFGAQSWVLEVGVVTVALVLLCMSVFR